MGIILNPVSISDLGTVKPYYQEWDCPDVNLQQSLTTIANTVQSIEFIIKDVKGTSLAQGFSNFKLRLNAPNINTSICNYTSNTDLPLSYNENGQKVTITFTINNGVVPLGSYQYNFIWEIYGVDNYGNETLLITKSFNLNINFINSGDIITFNPESLMYVFLVNTNQTSQTKVLHVECTGHYKIKPLDNLLKINNSTNELSLSNYNGNLNISTTANISNILSEEGVVYSGLVVTRVSDNHQFTYYVAISVQESIISIQNNVINFECYVGEDVDLFSEFLVSAASDLDLTVTNNNSWLEVTEVDTSLHKFKVSVIDISNLSPGIYIGSFSIIGGGQQIDITVNLKYYSWYSLVEDKWLLFTKDMDLVKFHTQNSESYFLLDANVLIKNDVEEISHDELWETALFKKKGEFHIGNELKNFINFNETLDNMIENIEHKYSLIKAKEPSVVNFRIKEKNLNTDEEIKNAGPFEMKYYPGITPPLRTSNIIFFLQVDKNPIRITRNSVLSVSMITKISLAKILNKLEIYQNDVLRKEVSIDTLNTMKSFFFKLDWILPGDRIKIKFQNEEKHFIAIEEEYDSFNIYYKEQWQSIECFEFTGAISREKNFEFIDFEGYKLFVNYLRRVESSSKEVFNINTGWIFKDNSDIIDRILNSSKCWHQLEDGKRIEIIPISKDIVKYDSNAQLYQYNLKFRINND